jgi:hypothetical protein
VLVVLSASGAGGRAFGQAPRVCPEDILSVTECAHVSLTFSHGDVLTVRPDGGGETLEEAGIRLRVRIYCGSVSCEPTGFRTPAGIPAEEIVLFDNRLCFCRPMTAARPTDANGETEFTGTLAAGGCADDLTLWVDGVAVARVPIRINSPDAPGASPCAVDASDLSALGERMGRPDRYSICFDYDESGGVNAGDLSYFAAAMGPYCE